MVVEIIFNKKHIVHMPFVFAVIFLWLAGEWQALDWVLYAHRYYGLTNVKITLKKPIKGVEICYNICSKLQNKLYELWRRL